MIEEDENENENEIEIEGDSEDMVTKKLEAKAIVINAAKMKLNEINQLAAALHNNIWVIYFLEKKVFLVILLLKLIFFSGHSFRSFFQLHQR